MLGNGHSPAVEHVARRALASIAILCAFLSPGFAPAHGDETATKDAPEIRRIGHGVTYSMQVYPRTRWKVHTVIADISDPSVGIHLEKGLSHIAGLERVADIAHRCDSIHRDLKVIAGVNANFWSAGSNYPIGPTAIDGQVLTGHKHRNWSAVAITETDDVHINNFSVRTEIVTRLGSMPVSLFNRRSDSASLVLYTPFFGSSVPYIDSADVFARSKDTLTDDSELDSASVQMLDSLYAVNPENGTLKIQYEMMEPPKVNTSLRCRITAIDTGLVAVPRNGGVLSFGKGAFPLFFSLFVGDTFRLSTRLDPVVPEPVTYMTSGTPRLVRNGKVSVEWQQEGLRKVRFVVGRYARTAFGVSRDGKRIILITVESTSRRSGRRGISLRDLARLMVDRGAYNAVNFDGGSSATMVLGHETVAPAGTRPSRKISTAFLIVDKSPTIK